MDRNSAHCPPLEQLLARIKFLEGTPAHNQLLEKIQKTHHRPRTDSQISRTTYRHLPDNFMNAKSVSLPENAIVKRYIAEHAPTNFKPPISVDDFGPPDARCTR